MNIQYLENYSISGTSLCSAGHVHTGLHVPIRPYAGCGVRGRARGGVVVLTTTTHLSSLRLSSVRFIKCRTRNRNNAIKVGECSTQKRPATQATTAPADLNLSGLVISLIFGVFDVTENGTTIQP